MPPNRQHPALPAPSCGNPQYYEILSKMAAEAQTGRNANWIRALRRAMHSLSLYPLPFSQPREAQQLANIGPAIVNVLERSIKAAGGHIEERTEEEDMIPDTAGEERSRDRLGICSLLRNSPSLIHPSHQKVPLLSGPEARKRLTFQEDDQVPMPFLLPCID